ncbi:hypothetical protein AB4Y43_07735, partial [Paraburkholderia sp. BR10872]
MSFCHALSSNAWVTAWRAGPLTVHAPRCARNAASRAGAPSANPQRAPASPKNLPGDLHEAAQRYGIAWHAWIDLSTGINPHGYPVPPVPS